MKTLAVLLIVWMTMPGCLIVETNNKRGNSDWGHSHAYKHGKHSGVFFYNTPNVVVVKKGHGHHHH
jgi:hypothetical protein